jgi:hypothetical protein
MLNRLVFAVVLAAPTAAFAQTPATPPAAPKPAPEIDQIASMVCTWNCTGSVPDSPFGPAHKTRTDVNIKKDLDGFWVSGTVKEQKSAQSPMPIQGNFHQTYDASKKQFVMFWVDNFGGWAQSTSPGWKDDTMAWTGEGYMGGQTFGSRDTFTKKGPGVLYHLMEMKMGETWTNMGDETCKKAAVK